jgi:hypothetical protein
MRALFGWLAGILSAVIAGLIVYSLTDGYGMGQSMDYSRSSRDSTKFVDTRPATGRPRDDYEPPPSPRRSYSAIAYCSMTGITGRSSSEFSPTDALEEAVYDCIDRGGIPECCESGARLIP